MLKKEEVEKLAELSRLTLNDNEIESFQKEIDSVLAYVSDIQKAHAEGEGVAETALVRNVFRNDGEPHAPGQYSDAVQKQFPKENKGYLKVKKIL